MKKNLLIVLTLVLLVSTSFANSFRVAEMNNSQTSREDRFEQISWIDDFEGEDNWTIVDETAAPQEWHIFNEGGTYGDVWWMGGDNGGYIDNLYLVLDTPAINVTAGNSTLTFDLNYNMEEPGGTGEYNGWDGANLRVSTDQENWTVLDGSPAYDATSMFSFGDIHGEGPNVPGWGGSSNGWTTASFDLSAYEGQTIYVRFAFASDPAYNTGDDEDMFGIKIDNIALGSFTNNGTAGDMVASSLVPLGGNNWNLAEVTNAFSGTHVYQLQNEAGSYDPNLLNAIVSPLITLPSEGEILATFEIMGAFSDPNAGGAVSALDYWGYEIQIDGSNAWYAMSNPYADPNGNNYIYPDAPDVWMPVHEAYSLEARIDDYAGEDVRFKIYFRSDDDTPEGSGIMVDDFRVTTEVYLAEAYNLQAEVMGEEVQLDWEQPLQMTETDVVWTNGSWVSYVNDGQPYAILVENTDSYDKPLSKIGFNLYNQTGVTGSAIVYAWENSAGLPGAEIASVDGITGMESQTWMNVDVMSENIMVPANGSIFVGVGGFDAGNQGLLADDSSTDLNSFAFVQGTWAAFEEVYTTDGGLNNCAIKATIMENDPTLPSADSYKVYHSEDGSNYTFLAETAETEYLHTSPVLGALNYYKVTSLFGINESQGVTTTAFLLPGGLTEVMNDDGTAEEGATAGVSNIMGAKFVHTHEATLQYIKFYIHTMNSANMLYRIYSAENGMPNENLATAVIQNADLVEGWNTIELQNEYQFENGQFFITFVNVNNAPVIGLDTNNDGNYYLSTDQGASWDAQTAGNLMVRALVVNGPVDNYNEEIAPVLTNVGNYPNPFNPETTIRFNMSKAGKANVAIYNLKGQLVKTILNGDVTAGNKEVVWNGTDAQNNSVASGVYFFRVKTDNQTINKKMVLQK
jgi:hypothetical protein